MKAKTRTETRDAWERTVDDKVEAALRRLTAYEEHVLRLRFGLSHDMPEIDVVIAWLPRPPRPSRRVERVALRKLRETALLARCDGGSDA